MPSGPASGAVRTTARLTLAPPTERDAPAWVRLHRDPRTYSHAPHAMPATDEIALAWFDANLARFADLGYGFWLARDRGSGAVVGVAGVRPVGEGADAHLNLYYRLAADRIGEGLGREMARAVLRYAAQWLPERPVRALVKEHNAASVATALSIGMERVGTTVLEDDLPDEPPSTVLEAPRIERCTDFDAATRAAVLDLWCAVNDAGGAVGFLPGAPRADVDAALQAHEASMRAGWTVAGLLRGPHGDVLGVAFLVQSHNRLLDHGRSIYRVMVDPARRGRGLGQVLMAGLHGIARRDGVEIVSLGVRSGHGTEAFYEGCGYAEVGRIRGAIRVAPGDDRDSITMSRRLD